MVKETPLVQRTPIARLPVELLTNIFAIIAHDPLYDGWDKYLPDTSIAISHVCAFWRNVALGPGNKPLWTHVPLRHGASWVRAFTERSQPLTVSLKIELGDNVAFSLSALAEAVTSLNRVKEMRFRSLYDEIDEFGDDEYQFHQAVFDLLASRPAPALEVLSWSYAHTYGDEEEPLLPFGLFAGKLPDKLRVLEVTGMDLIDHGLLHAKLTYLKIDNCVAWATVGDILDSLSCMPDLEEIVLNSSRLVIDDVQPSQTYVQRSVNLPRLDRFILTDAESAIAIVFFYLKFPSTARIHIELELPNDDPIIEGNIVTMRDALEAHYGADDISLDRRLAFSAVTVGQCGPGGITLQAAYRNTTYLSVSLAPGWWRQDTAVDVAVIGAAHILLHSSFIRTATQLNISHSNFFASGRVSDWLPLCSCMSNLETIVISRSALQGLCAALLSPLYTGSAINFPKLRELQFHGILFDEDTDLAVFFLVALVHIAWSRLRTGHPIKRIVLCWCLGAKELSEQLSAILPGVEVVWHKTGIRQRALVEKMAARWDDGDADLK